MGKFIIINNIIVRIEDIRSVRALSKEGHRYGVFKTTYETVITFRDGKTILIDYDDEDKVEEIMGLIRAEESKGQTIQWPQERKE